MVGGERRPARHVSAPVPAVGVRRGHDFPRPERLHGRGASRGARLTECDRGLAGGHLRGAAERVGRTGERVRSARGRRVRVRHPGASARVPPEPGAQRPGILDVVPAAGLWRGRPACLLLDRALPGADVPAVGHEHAGPVRACRSSPREARRATTSWTSRGRSRGACAGTSGSCCTAKRCPTSGASTPRSTRWSTPPTPTPSPPGRRSRTSPTPSKVTATAGGSMTATPTSGRWGSVSSAKPRRSARTRSASTRDSRWAHRSPRPTTWDPAAKRYPDMNFVAYHSGFESGRARGALHESDPRTWARTG